MPFIGTQPDVGGYSVLDNLTASATASYTLQKDSANFVPSSANQLLVSLNGVIQKPGSSFTVSGSTLTFSSALTSGDSIDFIIAMGEPLLVGTPSDATVTSSKLASNIGISTTGNIATTGSGTLSVAGASTLTGAVSTGAGLTVGNGLTVSDGNISVASGHGIDFSATANATINSASMGNELLDDYEEGTWTPTADGGSTTYNTQYGFYTKIGNLVHAQYNISVNNFTGSNRFTMGGLPFTSNNVSGSSGIGTVTYFNSLNTGAVMLTCRNDSNTSTVYFSGTTGSGATMANINHNVFGNGTNVFGAVIYRTA